MKHLLFCAILVVCTVNFIACDDDQDIVLKYKSNATFDCSDIENAEYFQKKEIGDEVKLENKPPNVQITADNKLVYSDLRGEDLRSEFYCKKGGSVVRKFKNSISPFIYKPEKQSQTVSEGSRVEFKCSLLFGNEDNAKVEWVWKKNDTELSNEEGRIDIKSTSNETSLTLNKVVDADKGAYECHLKNDHGAHSESINLRVKDALAALWPFLAICAEVFILCFILLIYEKKCSKKRNTADEDNEQTHNLMGRDGNADVKKRAVKA